MPALVLTAQSYNNIEFTENKGQWDPRVKFRGDINAGALYIRQGGFTVLQHNQQDLAAMYEMAHGTNHPSKESANTNTTRNANPDKLVIHSHAYNVDFVGASPQMRVIPDKKVSSFNNYFIGNDPSK